MAHQERKKIAKALGKRSSGVSYLSIFRRIRSLGGYGQGGLTDLQIKLKVRARLCQERS